MRKKLGRNHSRLSRPSTSGWDAHQTVGPVRQESTPRRRSRPWAVGHISICIESGMGQFSVCRRSESTTTTPTANPLRQMGSPCGPGRDDGYPSPPRSDPYVRPYRRWLGSRAFPIAGRSGRDRRLSGSASAARCSSASALRALRSATSFCSASARAVPLGGAIPNRGRYPATK